MLLSVNEFVSVCVRVYVRVCVYVCVCVVGLLWVRVHQTLSKVSNADSEARLVSFLVIQLLVSKRI